MATQITGSSFQIEKAELLTFYVSRRTTTAKYKYLSYSLMLQMFKSG